MNVIQRSSYVLIVDTDADCIDAAIRGCSEALPAPAVVARNGDDAIRILQQFGPPAVLLIGLALPYRDGLSVIESLRRIDCNAPAIAWTADRDLREYAANQLARARVKLLGGTVSPSLIRRCVDTLLQREGPSRCPAADDADVEENWLELAENARHRLRVAGAAAYTRAGGAAEYRLSVSWMPDAPMPTFSPTLLALIEEVMRRGAPRMWTDPVAGPFAPFSSAASLSGPTLPVALRSLAIVPIVRGNEIAGALCVFDLNPRVFGDDELETLSVVAGRSPGRQPVPAIPMDRSAAESIIQKEFARASRGEQALSVILFAVTARRPTDPTSLADVLTGIVRGNDLVIRWTSSQLLVILAGVDAAAARRSAERIRGAVETRAANTLAVSGAVSDWRSTDSLEDTVARAAERLDKGEQNGHPRTG